MKIPQFKGIITVITTPFKKDGSINFDVLAKHIEFLIAGGVHAILPCGSTGEYYTLSTEERRQLFAFVAEKVKGRLPIYAGTNSMRVDETVELSNYAAELGYEAIMLAAPPYAIPSRAELVEHFLNVAGQTSLPIILYNFPARTGVDMDAQFLTGVSAAKSICAIKESSGSFGRTLQHVILFDKRFQRICGFDDQALDQFLWGAKSWIAGASNFLPSEHVALYEACVVNDDWKRGKEIMATMMPLIYLLENGGKYIQYVKLGCELAGVPVGGVRPPMGGLTDEERANFRNLYRKLKAGKISEHETGRAVRSEPAASSTHKDDQMMRRSI
jgi:4-hydroxy-tetrahydrodipicolinate synthase